jgi:hypothetical protein
MALDDLAQHLVEREGRGDTPFGLYVCTADDPAAELARSVERDVFDEFFGNTPDMLAEEYGPYEGASLFFCVVDHLRLTPAGMIRMLLPSAAGSKSLNDLERVWGEPAAEVLARTGLEVDESSLWDIATLAVARDYRGAATSGLVSLALYQGVNVLAAKVDLAHAVAIFDLVVLDLVQSNFHRPFSTFAGIEPRRYLDSPSSLPVWCDVREYGARLAMLDADMYELLIAGVGMEAVISAPPWGLDRELDERWFRTA